MKNYDKYLAFIFEKANPISNEEKIVPHKIVLSIK